MNQEFMVKLAEILSAEQIHTEEMMSKHITFRVGGPAECLVQPTIGQMKEVVSLARTYEVPITVIGNGSNLLVSDNGIKGLVIEIGKQAEKLELEDGVLTVGAGTLLSRAANFAKSEGLSGMEFAAGIPGSMGGAVVMNAGAYGGEIKDILVDATVLTKDGEIVTIPAEELELGYRHSCILEKGYLVLEASVRLFKKAMDEIQAEMDDYRARRIEKQPLEYPSAGSSFKRPEGYFAGKLVQDAGLAGYTVGGAQVSEKHCGFIINKNHATASDVYQVFMDVQEKVYDTFGVKLEPEVKMIGEFK